MGSLVEIVYDSYEDYVNLCKEFKKSVKSIYNKTWYRNFCKLETKKRKHHVRTTL